MPNRRLRQFAALVATVALVFAACGDDDDDDDEGAAQNGNGAQELDLVTDGTLTVGTELPAPPFWIGDDYDSITGGFEVDMAKEMAERLGLDGVKFVEMPFTGVVAGQECPCDIDFSQVTITPERDEVAEFTEPYFTANQSVLANPGVTVETVDDAKTIQWGGQLATTSLDFLNDNIQPEKEPRTYQTTVDAFTALKAGQIDAIILDLPILLGAVKAGQVGDAEVVARFRPDEHYGGIVNKDSPNLERFNEVIREMGDDGTLTDLTEEYFGADPSDIPVIEVE